MLLRRSYDDFDDEDEDDDAPVRSWKRSLLYVALAGFGLFLGLLIPYVWVLDGQVREKFGALQWQVPTTVFAQPLKLAPALRMDAPTLLLELTAAIYRDDGLGADPGTYARDGGRFRIASRGFTDIGGPVAPGRIEVLLSEGRVVSIKDQNGKPLNSVVLDPARIAALYGASQEERQLVRAADLPPLLVTGLQAVEDRDFKSHHGVDVFGILRAAWVNAREGEMRQGGSTLTQQLVRGLFLSNQRSLRRKINEALYAIIIESRFDKQRILEAYLNQVYLGQQGSQSIHGVAAASQFWFGRPLVSLPTEDVALMIGLIKGPSYYDPRRSPDRALLRRNVVLGEFVETGLIDAAEAERAKAAPLGISLHPGIVTNRYPAFVDLVRRQLQTDYPADSLKGAGLVIHSTLDPAAQIYSEIALQAALDKAQRKKGPPLEGGLVVTDVRDGDVLAVVGGRDVTQPGFNRALDAQRPVGSLLKPFVYLLALAQPSRYSLASVVNDAPVTVTQPNGKNWSPSNSDGRSHGSVRLIDALAQSYNQATVRVGMDVQVERVAKIIKVLAGIEADPNPSLILGAVDQTPFAMAQLYQFLASGGEVQPLHAVRGVLDAHGALIKRYDSSPAAAQAGDALAARLVTLAMQQVVVAGTAHALQADGLGFLQAAGKTGTSNDSRDSWFAGFTGNHLAVIWVGNDQNAMTGLYGATGAMRVWSGLFKKLPSAPLKVSDQGMEWAWVSPAQLVSVDASCPGARHFAFVQGFAPTGPAPCDAAANPTDEQGWIRVPSADDANPELGTAPAQADDQGWQRVPNDSEQQQAPPAPLPAQQQDNQQ
jgi:penicillin-binding protein 1B